jgi:hypothetical protein
MQTGDETDLQFQADQFMPLAFMVWDGAAVEPLGTLGLTTWSVVFLEVPTSLVQYAWVPGVMIGVLVVELLIVWLVRRAHRRKLLEG